MKKINHSSNLSSLLFVCLLLFSVSVSSHDLSNSGAKLQNEALPPDDIKAVVYIKAPKEGTLLQLRGIAGKGLLIFRQSVTGQNDKTVCVSTPVRFAAGDFGGSTIGINTGGPIRLVIYSDKVAKKLIAGDEVVSENYDITDRHDSKLGDIKVESGLTLSYGFVLNPGEWSWSSIFGLDKKRVDCKLFNAS